MRPTGQTLVGLCCLLWLVRAHVFSLSDLEWMLRNQNGSIVIPGSLPSQAHMDLFKAGIIDDPLSGINEYTERWVVNDNWTYTADLTPFAQYGESSGSGRTLLIFYGIDTIANITFAGHPVAWVNNQFRRYTFDVSGYLTSPIGGDNNLTIALESAWYYGLNYSVGAPADIAFVGTLDNYEYPNVRQWIRKIEDDFGWDFGPAFVPSGIYKPAYLVTLSGSATDPGSPNDTRYPRTSSKILLDETSVDIYKDGQNVTFIDQPADWVVNVTFGMRSIKSYTAPTVTLSIPELGITSDSLALSPIPNETEVATYASVYWSIPDHVPERWYPWNLGTPKLYNLTITLNPSGEMTPRDESIAQTVTTGFRTIQLMQLAYSDEAISSRGITPGDQWHFEVNGKAFYVKGSNVVPFDPFYARTSPEAVRWILESAVKTGQNMVRVWGGGIFQPSDAATDGGLYDFYSACDELGILVWSELLFSDALYPQDPAYLGNIEPEVRENVRRIKRHPSNAQWAGGNGVELMSLSLNSSLPNGQHYLDEFLFYYQDYLHDIVLSETRSAPYTDACTTNGVLSLEPYTLRLANETPGYLYGDTEWFNYDATQVFNLSTYPVTRFVNEFGFHSMPSFYTWQDVLENPEDFAFNSTVVMARDHHPPASNLSWPNPNAPQGQYEMTSAVELWLPTPGTADANQTFSQWCWSTQVFQSLLVVAEIAWFRRGAGMGERNLGALVWQLNDIWPGVTWSAIEYSGRWKVASYGLASAYAPVIIQPFWMPENETLTVLAISDRWERVHGVAQLTWYDWTGRVLDTSRTSVSIPPLNHSRVYEGTGLSAILPAGYDASDVWLLMNLTAYVGGETVTHESYFTPVSLASARLVDPKIAVNVGDAYTFTLSAQGGVGAWAWLDHPHGTVGHFVDPTTGRPANGFYLVPGIDRTVQFIPRAALSRVGHPEPADFVARSLWNNTHL